MRCPLGAPTSPSRAKDALSHVVQFKGEFVWTCVDSLKNWIALGRPCINRSVNRLLFQLCIFWLSAAPLPQKNEKKQLLSTQHANASSSSNVIPATDRASEELCSTAMTTTRSALVMEQSAAKWQKQTFFARATNTTHTAAC